MDAPVWFYARDGVRHGALADDELRRLAAAGALRPHDLVWRHGMPQWQPARQATDLFQIPAAGASAPGAPPPHLPPPLPPQGAPPPSAQPGTPGSPHPYPQFQQKPLGEDPGVRMLLPVGRSGWAIAAGYLGLISVLGFPAPISVVISIIAIRDIKAHPDRHGMGRAVFGLIMGILGCVILAGMITGMMTNRGRW